LGSSTNPLFNPTFCGEMVGDVFFLNAAGEPNVEADCEVPAGTWLVGSPGGSLGLPDDATPTDAEILAARDADFVGVTDASATLDGKALDVESGFAKTGVYTVPVEAGSFIKELYPAFEHLDEARVASAAWMVRIPPLTPGR
jgi:hypothetical protein